MKPIHILVAGASGYVGQALIPYLQEKFPQAQITALARGAPSASDQKILWRQCDLFSIRSIEKAHPETVDLAFYLVHSMGPTAQLDQGNFADYDLILADNFARVLKQRGCQHLIYLGGLMPENAHLSEHLKSRLEVEEIFNEYKLPLTVFRAGLIMGETGSSFQILLKLVKRLRVMICPKWTQTLTTPSDLQTVIKSLAAAALDLTRVGKVYDLASCQALTYIEMMKETARFLNLTRLFVTVPFFTPTLSRLWVSLITNSPKALVYPLIESLEHPMVARAEHLFDLSATPRPYAEVLRNVSTKTISRPWGFRFRPRGKSVRSVQRLLTPPLKNAEWVKNQYIQWLPLFLKPFIKVRTIGESVYFSFLSEKPVLLHLRFSPERSSPDRQLLYIVGGWLATPSESARLEFRLALNRKFILAAIHDYRPALPWFLYVWTQAKIHLFVMKSFGAHIAGEKPN